MINLKNDMRIRKEIEREHKLKKKSCFSAPQVTEITTGLMLEVLLDIRDILNKKQI